MADRSFNPDADYESQQIGRSVDANPDILSPSLDPSNAQGECRYPILLLSLNLASATISPA
jgi:hypothetical protein